MWMRYSFFVCAFVIKFLLRTFQKYMYMCSKKIIILFDFITLLFLFIIFIVVVACKAWLLKKKVIERILCYKLQQKCCCWIEVDLIFQGHTLFETFLLKAFVLLIHWLTIKMEQKKIITQFFYAYMWLINIFIFTF